MITSRVENIDIVLRSYACLTYIIVDQEIKRIFNYNIKDTIIEKLYFFYNIYKILISCIKLFCIKY